MFALLTVYRCSGPSGLEEHLAYESYLILVYVMEWAVTLITVAHQILKLQTAHNSHEFPVLVLCINITNNPHFHLS